MTAATHAFRGRAQRRPTVTPWPRARVRPCAPHGLASTGPGRGRHNSLGVLAERPELGELERRCAAGLAGRAPIAPGSGPYRGEGFIGGGRANLRQAITMPALLTPGFNVDLKAKWSSLHAAGKSREAAQVAVMGQLTILANALLRDHSPWSAQLA